MPPPQQDSHTTRLFAFTLAEFLITLGIIGVVAAITIPALIQNYKKHVTINQLKASYSILSQAVNSAKQEHGDISNWDFELSNTDFADKYILPYLKISKTISGLNDKFYWRMNTLGTKNIFTSWAWDGGQGNNVTKNPIYILSNGSAITISHFFDLQMRVTIDINARKAPNMMGIDGFVFYFDKKSNQLRPVGFGYDRSTMLNENNGYSCTRRDSPDYYQGSWCAALIMLDGWQISKDYPW